MTVDAQVEIIRRGAVLIESEEELRAKLAQGRPLRVKHGADASSPRLHLGHAVQLRKLRQFQELGHEVIFIIGDFTARVGDPSGKSETRRLLSKEEAEHNARRFTEQAGKILDMGRVRVVLNSEWFSKMKFEDVIGLASKATVARILERDDFAKRFAANHPISVLELLYPLFQGYDSVAIDADIEMGGTDQTFNFHQARALMRAHDMEPQVLLTMPLLEGTDGHEKMGKSLGNTIDLIDTPAEKFGKIMSLPDHLMTKCFWLLTDVPEADLTALDQGLAGGTLHPGELKRRLAREIITFFDSAEDATAAEREFDARHKADADAESLRSVADDAPLSLSELDGGRMWLPKLLTGLKLVGSTSEARRMVQQGAVRIEGKRIADFDVNVPVRDGMLVAVGKRRVVKVALRG